MAILASARREPDSEEATVTAAFRPPEVVERYEQ
jgi:hypothetical protein